MAIILDELKYAKRLLEHGSSNYMSMRDLCILARYFKYIGKNTGQIRKSLEDYCFAHDSSFNLVIFDWKIIGAIKSSKQNYLRIPSEIYITAKEIEIIKSIKNYKLEKILFVMLVLSKNMWYNSTRVKEIKKTNYNFYTNAKFTEILKLAKVNVSKKERNEILHYLNSTELISATHIGTYKINFVDRAEDDIFIIVTDIENLLNYYQPYCCKCGKQLTNKSRKHDMCKECYDEYRKEKVRDNVRNYRNKI